MDPEHEKIYMLRRSLLLLLGGKKLEGADAITINFRPEVAMANMPMAPTFVEVLAVLNMWASGKSITEWVLPSLGIPYEYVVSTRHVAPDAEVTGQVNWSATLEAWSRGKSGYVIWFRERRDSVAKTDYIAFVLKEFIAHWSILRDLVTDLRHGSNEHLREICIEIDEYVSEIEVVVEERFHEASKRVSPWVDKAAKLFKTALAEPKGNSGGLLTTYADRAPYEQAPEEGVVNEIVRALETWRTQYLAGNVWLSDDFVFQHTQNGTMQSLYTMWCYVEFSLALVRAGLADLVEYNLVVRQDRHREPTVRHGDEFVYFDRANKIFRPVHHAKWGPLFERGQRLLLREVHPEWLLWNSKKRDNSVVLSANYEGDPNQQLLELLGHAHNYGIKITVALGREDLGSTVGVKLSDGLRLSGRGVNGEKLYAARLKPVLDSEKQNAQVLDDLVRRLKH